ncbi:RNA polymerase sigma factor [Billgrantia gudaonensis]|uniref:RNA polymerase sigma-70 factor, ECF subfamily n=1 Tax=Billgrantia gudaonensis TaxID=376427 RepID=A0A1G8VQZ1_9GAMM|nr:sigma-70 family RNA polymerase sigma factor [Halomonas gudaonensis]SDJ68491.1 RNA polymerase sigma-70 factor, ECF subfamily [Halomonas gudaonensis]
MPTSPRALLQLFLSERSRLIKRIDRLVNDEAVAEDLAQDAFVKLWRRDAERESSPGLLHLTAHNLAMDHLRARQVRLRHRQDERAADEGQADPGPEAVAETLESWERLMAMLEALPARARRVFLLNRVEGETYAAIARRLNVSVSTVEKDMMQAMRVCRDWQRQQSRE